MTGSNPRAAVRTVFAADARPVSLGAAGSQQVLLGGPSGEPSPLVLGITRILAGQTSQLIAHDTSEVAYVLAGSGWMVTDTSRQAFAVGDAIVIEALSWHAIQAGDVLVEMLYVFPTSTVPLTWVHNSMMS